jgi:FkbM family methyltransferase
MYFDIGANIGNWSLANIENCDKIIAIEASPNTYTKLTNNCINDKIILLNYAVCTSEDDIIFYESEFDTLSTINKEWLTDIKSRFYGIKYTEIICKTISIDKLIEIYGLPKLIKIDVEGGEYECISSLSQKVDLLCFEWASELVDIAYQCINYLSTLGFTEYYIQYEDNYTFMPDSTQYYNKESAENILSNSTPKVHWGMVWCK